MTVNFLLNNWLTFQDRRLRGWSILKGLASFYLACSIGALTSLALAKFLYTSGIPWYLAGVLGTVVSSVWNYSVTSVFIWRRGRVGRVDSEPGDIPATQQTSEHPYD